MLTSLVLSSLKLVGLTGLLVNEGQDTACDHLDDLESDGNPRHNHAESSGVRNAAVQLTGTANGLEENDDAMDLAGDECQPDDWAVDEVELSLVHCVANTWETGNAGDDEEGE